MNFLDLTLPTAAANLALDEAFLLAAEAGESDEVLRLWEWPTPAVVLGAACKLAEDVDEERCRADGVPVLRRSSGGGTVLLGRGCLCYSLVLRFDRDPALAEIPTSYICILDRLLAALAGAHPDLRRAGTSDLAAGAWKFSGNAQQRKRTHLLHHGTLLYAFDLSLIPRYLRPPARQPEYRARREHLDFVTNLPVRREELKRRLREAWGAREESASWPQGRVAQLVEEKYGKPDWIRRR